MRLASRAPATEFEAQHFGERRVELCRAAAAPWRADAGDPKGSPGSLGEQLKDVKGIPREFKYEIYTLMMFYGIYSFMMFHYVLLDSSGI